MMKHIEWMDLLGWSEEELSDLRFVGYSYIRQGHYATALKFFEALVILSPNSAYDLQTLGALYLETNDNLKALSLFDRALKIDPLHGPTRLNQAKALLMLGYHKQGLDSLTPLLQHEDLKVRNQAEALLLVYR